MRPHVFLALAAFASAASQVTAQASDSGHDMHGEQMLFWGAGAEIDHAEQDWLSDAEGSLVTWDGYAWIGDDDLKLRLEAEGEAEDGDIDHSELKTLLSWNVDEFWDLQAGARFDLEDGGNTWAAFGVHGMMPYFIETDAFVYVDRDGNVAFHAAYEMDFAVTQDIFIQPQVEIEAFAQDMPERGVGEGLSDLTLGLQLRYEITRKLAPYVEVVHERALGETSQIMQDNGEDPESTTIRFGFRFRL